MKSKRFIAILLTLVLVISQVPTSVFAKSDRLPEQEHEKFDFSTLEYVHIEEEEVEEIINRLNEISKLCKDEANKDKIIEIVEWYDNEELPNLKKLVSVAGFFKDINPYDAYWQNECNYIKDVFKKVDEINKENLLNLYDSPCKDVLIEYAGENIIEKLTSSTTSVSESYYLSENIVALLEEYYSYEPTIEYEGKTYTSQDIWDACNYGEISYEEYLMLYNEVKNVSMPAYSDIYLRLVKEYNKLPRPDGYESYLDYSYKKNFYRDFSPEQAALECKKILEILKPYKMYFSAYETDQFFILTNELLKGDVFDTLRKITDKIAPELKESYEYMLDTNACFIFDTSSSLAFTSFFKNIPYIRLFDDANDIYDLMNLAHEFGHYNADYWNISSKNFNLDLHEIYSHGLELISTVFYDDLFGELSKCATGFAIGLGFNEIYYSAIRTLIEILAFSRDFESTEDFCDEVNKITEKYIPGEYNAWYTYRNFFIDPGYEYSYVTSRLSAFELYLNLIEDFDTTIDSYIRLIANFDSPTNEAKKESGLTVNWTKKKLKKLFEKIFSIYADTETPVIEGVEDGQVYLGSKEVHIKDDSKVYSQLFKDGENKEFWSDYIFLYGTADPIWLSVTDAFGNNVEMEFMIEPYPYILTAELTEDGDHKLTWPQYDFEKSTKYKVYGAPLGEKFKKLATLDGNEFSYINKVTDDRIWKYYVIPYCDFEYTGNYVKQYSSNKCFITSGNNVKYTNPKAIEIVGDKEITLKVGETVKVPVTFTKEIEDKKLYSSRKNKKLSLATWDYDVVEASNGTITALSEGTAYVYAVSVNGLTDRIIVHVEP